MCGCEYLSAVHVERAEEVRLEGFEPPTNGLEGRRSSAELQAPGERVQRRRDAYGDASVGAIVAGGPSSSRFRSARARRTSRTTIWIAPATGIAASAPRIPPTSAPIRTAISTAS